MKFLLSLLFLGMSLASCAQQATTGIEGEQAPEFEINQWIDGSGKETEAIKLQDYAGEVVVIFCFQHWCPGCHDLGFPSLKYLVNRFKDNEDVNFLAVQTAFEGMRVNTFKKIRKTQQKYKLKIPFAHDDGSGTAFKQSALMHNYKTGGTPWFIVIDKSGKVIYNNFDLDIQQGRRLIKRALEAEVKE